jgi:hypothetical protein
MRRFPSIRRWTSIGLFLIAVILLETTFQTKAQEGPKETFQIMPLNETMGSADPATGAVRLNRTRNELWASVHVTELNANSAFTVWAAVFNRPEGCTTNPVGPVHCSAADFSPVPNPAKSSAFNVGAFITGPDGTANINVHIPRGAPPEGAFILAGDGGVPMFNNGVRPGLDAGNGFGAEVHIVIRAHGPINADPAVLISQLSTLNGGCMTPPGCPNVQVATFPSVPN